MRMSISHSGYFATSARPTRPAHLRREAPCAAKQHSLPALLDVFLEPPEYLFVPEFAVRRLRHPVALVREVDELRFDPLPLQRRKQLVALPNRAAEVQIVLDQEHRRLELAEVARLGV